MSKQIIAKNVADYIARNTPGWGPREYPLISRDAANACPSAVYVGGVSGWLCKCRRPADCGGVLAAAQLSTAATDDESIGLTVARLGVSVIRHDVSGQGAEWHYRGMRSPRPAAGVVADEQALHLELFRRFGIKAGEPLHCGRWHVRVFAQAADGSDHSWETEINGSPDSIYKYFVGQPINIGSVEDLICTPRRVDFIAAIAK